MSKVPPDQNTDRISTENAPFAFSDWNVECLRLLVDGVVDYAIFILDPHGRVQTWNPGAERIKGYKAHEIIGQHFSVFYEEEAKERGWPEEELRRATLYNRLEDEGWRLRKDGTRFWANVVLTALRTSDGTLRGFAKITRDLTERRVHEESARRILALEEVAKRSTQFLATLGHELRNPLAPIRSALAVMGLVPGDDPRSISSRKVIERQVENLAHLLDDLLDTGRVMTGRIALDLQLITVSEVVKRSLECVGPSIASRSQHLDVEVEDGWVCGDSLRLVQTLQNLLNNASKYTKPGGHISIKTGHEGDEIFLAVRDTGIGILAELLPQVFEPFVQAERALSRTEGGLGLGLALAQQVAALHSGRVVAESAGLQQGSTFTLWLPAVPAPTPPPEPPQAKGGLGRRVLVVDDNRDAADVLKLAIELSGHDVTATYDGPSALAIAAETQPELILLDLGLPGLSGFEVAAQLRARKGHRPYLVALTGYGQEEDKRRTLAAGFDRHLVKPIDLDMLAALLDDLPG